MISILLNPIIDNSIAFPGKDNADHRFTFDRTYGVAIGDINNDENNDLVVTDVNNDNAFIYIQNDNNFNEWIEFELNTGYNPYDVEIGDLNDDGLDDIIICNGWQSTHHSDNLMIWYQDGNGIENHEPDRIINVGLGPRKLEIVDINNDGKEDICVVNVDSNNAMIFYQEANNSFDNTPDIIFNGLIKPNNIKVGHLNNDERIDIAICNAGSNNISIFYQSSNNDFLFSSHTNISCEGNPHSLDIGDLNDDGKDDIIGLNSQSATEWGNTATIFYQKRDFTFDQVGDYTINTGDYPFDVKIADINGDEKEDVVIVNRGIESGIFRNGNCTINLQVENNIEIQHSVSLRSSSSPLHVDIGDLDGDGSNDIAISSNPGDLYIFLNEVNNGPYPPSDLICYPGDNQIDLSWSPPNQRSWHEIEGYRIYRKLNDTYSLIEQVNSEILSYVDTTAINGNNYTYYITAFDYQNEGRMSDHYRITPKGKSTPPVNINCIPNFDHINISWEEPKNNGGFPIDSYRIYRLDGSNYTIIGETDMTSHTDILVSSGSNYSYFVVALTSFGEGLHSDVVNVTLPNNPDIDDDDIEVDDDGESGEKSFPFILILIPIIIVILFIICIAIYFIMRKNKQKEDSRMKEQMISDVGGAQYHSQPNVRNSDEVKNN